MIELRTLAYFVTACRSETLAHAAAAHGIALSTLSAALKVLEQDVGATLFSRIHIGLYPTAQARGLLRLAEPLLNMEAFARRWLAAQRQRRPQLLTVDLGLSHTIGGVTLAMQRAIDSMSADRPDILVDAAWTDEKEFGEVHLADALHEIPHNRLIISLDDGHARDRGRAVTLLSDPWVFATRLPTGTRSPASAADLAAGRLVVPALAPPLIEQVDRYLRRHKMSGVRFVTDHPAELPRLIDEYPDAAMFVPQSLVSSRLGFLRVRTVAPRHPLIMKIVARAPAANATSALFVRHLRRALSVAGTANTPRPVLSLRQIHYFNMVHRVRSISAAAQGAGVSQPALTEQLHKLEDTLDSKLFKRRNDGVIPTGDGDRFSVAAKMIEARYRRIVAGDAAAAAPAGRRITIGILPSVSQHGLLVNRITEAVVEVQARRPGLKLVIREAPNGTLQDWVMRGLVGVAIVETGLPRMPRLPLGSSEGLAVVHHAKQPLLPAGPIKLADLTNLRLALPTGRFGLRQLLDAAAEERGLKFQPAIEVDALTMVAALLERLPVCTVLPPSAIHRELADGELIAHPIVDPVIARRLFVIYSGERSLTEPERDLVNTLRSRLAEPQNSRPAMPRRAAP